MSPDIWKMSRRELEELQVADMWKHGLAFNYVGRWLEGQELALVELSDLFAMLVLEEDWDADEAKRVYYFLKGEKR